MIRNIKRTWFEVWGTEEAQNRFLKALLVFFVAQNLAFAAILAVLAVRKPPVVAVSATESRVLSIVPPRKELLETEIRRAVTGYITAHYNWEWPKIEDAFRTAARFVSPDFTKRFLAANQDQMRVAREKKVSQRFYLGEVTVDPKTKTARIFGERVLVVEGLRAANPLTVEVEFEYGARSEDNPEGIYIIGEKLVGANDGGAR